MIRRTPPSGTLVTIPLRDALRGAERVWDATEELLEPVAAVLPPALASRLKGALDQAERAALGDLHEPPTGGDIASAARFLAGPAPSVAGAEAFARVLAFAMDRAARSTQTSFMVSEAIAVSTALSAGASLTGPTRAADVLLALRRTQAAGTLPGVPLNLTPETDRNIDLAFFATALWLLSEREDRTAREWEVFQLALALTRTLGDQVIAMYDRRDTLAAGLEEMSDHV